MSPPPRSQVLRQQPTHAWDNADIDLSVTVGTGDTQCPSFAPECEDDADDINTVGKNERNEKTHEKLRRHTANFFLLL